MGRDERQLGYRMELENFFRQRLVEGRDRLSRELWTRDHSSPEAYRASVEGRREAWRDLLSPPLVEAVGEPEVRASLVPGAKWITVRLEDGLTAQGALVVPEGATRLVVFVHGLGSSPERVFGVGDEANTYDRVGCQLVEAGYAVLAPMNLIDIAPRNRAQSLCRLAGTTMEGLEFTRYQHLLDAVAQVAPALDLENHALAGMSWGGLATQYWSPLEDRVAVAASLGFFNHRPNKMVVQDTRYGTFYDSGEEHAFLHGLLLGFSDADLASLLCPRPFMVQHGRADMIGWWPQVVEEFERARQHWRRLGVADRVHLDLHDDGHVVHAGPLVDWLATTHPPHP